MYDGWQGRDSLLVTRFHFRDEPPLTFIVICRIFPVYYCPNPCQTRRFRSPPGHPGV